MCNKMITLTVFLITTIVGIHANLPSKQTRNCTQPGPLCETCSNVVACIQHSDGSWSKNAIGTCTKDQNCFNGTCTTDPEPICDGTAELDFECTRVGIFPDPFYCNKFVLCIDRTGHGKLVAYTYECSDGYGYNAGTSACDVKLEGGQCREGQYPVPVCQYIGQSEALEDNPSIYYTCEQYSKVKNVLYPVLDKCPHGEVYENYGCHVRESSNGDETTVNNVETTVRNVETTVNNVETTVNNVEATVNNVDTTVNNVGSTTVITTILE